MKYVLVALIAATPAVADCVTAANLSTGIAFAREDGRSGLVVGDGETVQIDYSTMKDDWVDRRVTRMGIYELEASLHYDALPTVGGGYPHYRWTYESRGIAPVPGKSFRARITQRREEDIGTQNEPPPDLSAYDVTYRFLDAKQVTLSDCRYTIIPVEADYAGGVTQRWVYFPDLGFGLETLPRPMENNEPARNGLTSLTPK